MTTAKTVPERRMADPRWQRTRERLLRVGFELIGEAGAEGVGIDAIIDRAGVSKQTFYNHFADRDVLTRELWLESRRVFELAITQANVGLADPVQRLARGVAIYARLAIVDPAHAQFIARTNIRSGVIAAANRGLERDLADGIAQGRLRLDDVAAAAVLVSGVTLTLIANILDSQDAAYSAALCRNTLALLLRGLGCDDEEGRRIAGDATMDMLDKELLDEQSN
jgi:AcrR family transcriptional regulator